MKLCLGTVQFGSVYGIQGIGQPKHEAVYDMLSYSIERGITYFDTASAYGEAEEVLGGFVRKYPDLACEMQLISKLHPKTFMENNRDSWESVVEKKATESLRRLGIDHFSSYLFHDASLIFDKDAVKALSIVKRKGLSDNIGVSVYSPEEAMKSLEYDEIGTIQIPYNVFDRRLDKCSFFEKAKEKGIIVFARSCLLQGLLMMEPIKLPDNVCFARKYLRQYDDICNNYGVSKLCAAVGYVSQRKGIDFIVFGVDNKTQLEEFIKLGDNTIISEEMAKKIDQVFYDVPEKLVNPALWN